MMWEVRLARWNHTAMDIRPYTFLGIFLKVAEDVLIMCDSVQISSY